MCQSLHVWSRRIALALVIALTIAPGCAQKDPLISVPADPPSQILIRGVPIFDGISEERTFPRDVLLSDGRITRVAPGGSLKTKADMVLIGGVGLTLMPGLIDLHGHVGSDSGPIWEGALPDPDRNLESYLYCGVTTVFDPGALETDTFDRRNSVAAGELSGPTMFSAGPIFTAPGGHPAALIQAMVPWYARWYLRPRFTREVATVEEARAGVQGLLPYEPDAIKVVVDAIPLEVPIIGGDIVRAIVDEARAHGLRTVAHIGTVEDALRAADAGVAAWMHGVYKERIPADAVPRMAAADIPYVATSVVFDAYADVFDGERVATRLERETVDAAVLDGFAPVPDNYGPADLRRYVEVLAATREDRCENIRLMHDAGVTVLAGADAQSGVFPGPGLHRELVLLAACGLTPAEALRAATGEAARFVADDPDPEFGIVAEGKRADLILVEGDPTADITATERIREVFQRGVRLERHPLGS